VIRIAALLAGAAILAARAWLVAVTVVGDSMVPTLLPGDRVLVARTGLRRVRRGQLVVFAPPRRPPGPADPPWMVKRVVALPGDVVPASVSQLAGARVPADRFVVLGDNATRSWDSRRAGYLPADALLGVVLRRMGNAAEVRTAPAGSPIPGA
jgi:signal peptidase I